MQFFSSDTEPLREVIHGTQQRRNEAICAVMDRVVFAKEMRRSVYHRRARGHGNVVLTYRYINCLSRGSRVRLIAREAFYDAL